MMRFDRVPSTFLNISGSFYVTYDLNFHNQSTFWWISNFWPPFWPQRPLKKTFFHKCCFGANLWTPLLSCAFMICGINFLKMLNDRPLSRLINRVFSLKRCLKREHFLKGISSLLRHWYYINQNGKRSKYKPSLLVT